jgi:hypothetical protein
MMEEPEQELLDSDLAMRTAMYFGLGISRDEALSRVGVPWSQTESWDELWDDLEQEEIRKNPKG